MIKLLMLGSSHSACFKKLTFPEKVEMSIFANRGLGLFHNLRINENGDFSLLDTASTWDQEVFTMSGDGSSQNIFSYTHLIINISFPLDLPIIFHGDKKKQIIDNMILTASSTLCRAILNARFYEEPNIKKTIDLMKDIVNIGFPSKNIFVLPTPFSCAKWSYKAEDACLSTSLSEKIGFILNLSQSIARDDFKIPLAMPDVEMLEAGMFLKQLYSTPDKYTTWYNLSGKKFLPQDRIHKNPSYAQKMFSKILASMD